MLRHLTGITGDPHTARRPFVANPNPGRVSKSSLPSKVAERPTQVVQRPVNSKHDCRKNIQKIFGQCPSEFPQRLRSIVEECGTDLKFFSTLGRPSSIKSDERALYHDASTACDLKSGLYGFDGRVIRVVEVVNRQESENGWQMVKLQGQSRDVSFREGWWRKMDALIVQTPNQNANAPRSVDRLNKLDKYFGPNEAVNGQTPAQSRRSSQILSPGQIVSSCPVPPRERHRTDIQLLEGPSFFKEFPPPLQRKLVEIEKLHPHRIPDVIAHRWSQEKSLDITTDGRKMFFKVDNNDDSPILKTARYSYGTSHQVTVAFIPNSKCDGRWIPIMIKGGHGSAAVTLSGQRYMVSKWRVTGAKDVVNYRDAPLRHISRFTEVGETEEMDADFVVDQRDSDQSSPDDGASNRPARELKRSRRCSSAHTEAKKKPCLEDSSVGSAGAAAGRLVCRTMADQQDKNSKSVMHQHDGKTVKEDMSACMTEIWTKPNTEDAAAGISLCKADTREKSDTSAQSVEDVLEPAQTISTTSSPKATHATVSSGNTNNPAYEGIKVIFRDQHDASIAVEPFDLNDSACKLFGRTVVHKLVHPAGHRSTLLKVNIAGDSEYIGLGVEADWRRSILDRLAVFAPKQPVHIIVKAVKLRHI